MDGHWVWPRKVAPLPSFPEGSGTRQGSQENTLLQQARSPIVLSPPHVSPSPSTSMDAKWHDCNDNI